MGQDRRQFHAVTLGGARLTNSVTQIDRVRVELREPQSSGGEAGMKEGKGRKEGGGPQSRWWHRRKKKQIVNGRRGKEELTEKAEERNEGEEGRD